MEEQYEVEYIVGHVPKNASRMRTKRYVVKWLNYDSDENTEEDKKTIEKQIPDAVDEYWIAVSTAKKAKKGSKNTSKDADSGMEIKLVKPGGTLTAAEMGIKEEVVSDNEEMPTVAVPGDNQMATKGGSKKSKTKPKQEIEIKEEAHQSDGNEDLIAAPPTPPLANSPRRQRAKAKPKKEKIKQETAEVEEVEQVSASGRSRRRGQVRISYREANDNDDDELSGMEDEDADEDFNPIAKGHKRGRRSYAEESESEEEPEEEAAGSEADSDKENDGPTTSKQSKKTTAKPVAKPAASVAAKPAAKPAAAPVTSAHTTSTTTTTTSAARTTSTYRAPTTNNRNRFQKHCKSCGKTLTAAEIANPHSTDLAPFQARLDYLVKERKKYAKMLEELEKSKLSDDEEELPAEAPEKAGSDKGSDQGVGDMQDDVAPEPAPEPIEMDSKEVKATA